MLDIFLCMCGCVRDNQNEYLSLFHTSNLMLGQRLTIWLGTDMTLGMPGPSQSISEGRPNE